ncbi:MAG: hypothetical protein RL318_282 [Fibrobacterota bacterium]
MRKVLASLLLALLWGCAVPVGNLAALQGEGLQLGTRLTASGPFPNDPDVDPAVPAAGTLYAAWVQPWWYAKGEAGLFPVAGLGTGGSLACGLHWQDRVALGGHVILNEGAGYGLDVALRPLQASPWVAGFSWTPQQLYPQDSVWTELPRPRVGIKRDMEWSLGWAPAPSEQTDGALSVEMTLRHGGAGWIAGVRLAAATRLFVPKGP